MLNLKFLILVIAIFAPAVFAAVNGACSDNSGFCTDYNTCFTSSPPYSSAASVPKLCPNDSKDIKCCRREVTKNGVTAVCRNVKSCNAIGGTTYSGYCPGSNDVKLCVLPKQKCQFNYGTSFSCQNINKRKNGNKGCVTGYCPGANNIKCCPK